MYMPTPSWTGPTYADFLEDVQPVSTAPTVHLGLEYTPEGPDVVRTGAVVAWGIAVVALYVLLNNWGG